MLGGRLAGVLIGVFEPIEVVLERSVVLGDQGLHRLVLGTIPARQPAVRIRLLQGPVHDRQALGQHRAGGHHQGGHRAAGGGRQQLRRLVAQRHLT